MTHTIELLTVDLPATHALGRDQRAYWKVCTCGVRTMARLDLGRCQADEHPCVTHVEEQGSLW